MIKDWAQIGAMAMSLATSEAAAEEQAEREREEFRIDLREDLHERQLKLWDDPRKLIPVMCSRRAGKSECVIRKVCDLSQKAPDTVNPYISITRKHAKINFWKLFKRIARRLDPDCKINESDLTIDFAGGGMVWLGGADKLDELEKYRASKCAIAVVDECQRFPSENLKYLVQEVIEPALLDLDAPLILSGTPGKVMLAGQYWYDLTGPESTYDPHRWTWHDNPFLDHERVEKRLAEMREARGWTLETPAYVREYEGRWCDDPDSLVIRLTPAHVVDELPTRNSLGRPIDPEQWRAVITADVGVVDDTAISVVLAHPELLETFVVLVEKHQRWLPRQLGARIKAIQANKGDVVPPELAHALARAPIVIDTGGMGKVHAEELTRTWLIGVTAAQKTDRESAIEMLRDKANAMRLRLLADRCQPLIEECAVLGWDEDKLKKGRRVTDADAVDHAFDSVLYGVRRLYTYVTKEQEPDPEFGTPEAKEAEAQDMRKRAMERFGRRDSGRPSWDA